MVNIDFYFIPMLYKAYAKKSTFIYRKMLVLEQPQHGFRYSVDAILLASIVNTKPHHSILDAGAGVGAVALHIAERFKYTHQLSFDLCEYHSLYARYCLKNIAPYQTHHSLQLLEQDFFTLSPQHWQYDIIVSNPPFHLIEKSDLSQDTLKNCAKFLSTSTLQLWLHHIIALLRPRASAYIILRPDDLHHLYMTLPQYGCIITITPLIDYGKRFAKRILIHIKCKKGSKAPIQTIMQQSFALHDANGHYTQQAKNILFSYQAMCFE